MNCLVLEIAITINSNKRVEIVETFCGVINSSFVPWRILISSMFDGRRERFSRKSMRDSLGTVSSWMQNRLITFGKTRERVKSISF